MSEATANRPYWTAVTERLARWITLRWALKTLGLYLIGALIAAAVFLVVTASMVYPEKTWIIIVAGFFVITLATVISGLKITFSSGQNRFEIQVRAKRFHLS